MKFASGMASKLSRFVVAACRERRLLGLLAVCLALLMSEPEAYADCVQTVSKFPDTVLSFPATIDVPLNAPDGTVLATTGRVPVTGATAGLKYGTCTAGGATIVQWLLSTSIGSLVSNRVGTTSVPGIGYTSSLSGGGLPDAAMDYAFGRSVGPLTFTSQLYVTVNLVKTGPVTPGALSLNPTGPGVANRVATFFVGGPSRTPLFDVTLPGNASYIRVPACTVTTPSPNVPLGTIRANALTGIGSTTGETPFPITLNCPSAGSRVSITLTDNANPANTSTTLSLESGSTASGVALQVLNANTGTPVAFGPDSSAPGNTNQWLAGTSSGGPMTIPLTVRYLQTAKAVKAGTVNAVATFTMSYQ